MNIEDFRKDLERQANLKIGDKIIAIRNISTVTEELKTDLVAHKDSIGEIVNFGEEGNSKFYLVEFITDGIAKRLICINNLGMNIRMVE
jgi:hypothetical protein